MHQTKLAPVTFVDEDKNIVALVAQMSLQDRIFKLVDDRRDHSALRAGQLCRQIPPVAGSVRLHVAVRKSRTDLLIEVDTISDQHDLVIREFFVGDRFGQHHHCE